MEGEWKERYSQLLQTLQPLDDKPNLKRWKWRFWVQRQTPNPPETQLHSPRGGCRGGEWGAHSLQLCTASEEEEDGCCSSSTWCSLLLAAVYEVKSIHLVWLKLPSTQVIPPSDRPQREPQSRTTQGAVITSQCKRSIITDEDIWFMFWETKLIQKNTFCWFVSAGTFRLCCELLAPTCQVCARVAWCRDLASVLQLHSFQNHNDWTAKAFGRGWVDKSYHASGKVWCLWLDCEFSNEISPKSASKPRMTSDSQLDKHVKAVKQSCCFQSQNIKNWWQQLSFWVLTSVTTSSKRSAARVLTVISHVGIVSPGGMNTEISQQLQMFMVLRGWTLICLVTPSASRHQGVVYWTNCKAPWGKSVI